MKRTVKLITGIALCISMVGTCIPTVNAINNTNEGLDFTEFMGFMIGKVSLIDEYGPLKKYEIEYLLIIGLAYTWPCEIPSIKFVIKTFDNGEIEIPIILGIRSWQFICGFGCFWTCP